MNKKTDCNKCKKEFTIKLKTKTHKLVIKETYFNCPYCKEKYIAFVTDAECRKLQRDIRALIKSKEVPAKELIENKIDDEQYKEAIDAIRHKINRVNRKLEPKMNKLKSEWS